MLTAAADSVASGVNIVYYVLGCIGFLLAAVIGGWRFYLRQRRTWTEEGEARAEQAQAIKDNNAQLTRNTDAIGKLTEQMGQFADSVRNEIALLNGRLTRVEERLHWNARERKWENSGPGK